MIWLTDAVSKTKIAVNPTYVVAVFVAAEGEVAGKTVVSLTNGTTVVEESDIDVVGMISTN